MNLLSPLGFTAAQAVQEPPPQLGLVGSIPSNHEDQMVWWKVERHSRNEGEEIKPQTGTSQVSVMTCTLHFHPHPRRQDMDLAGGFHTGCCSVNTGTSAQSDCWDPVGLCWVWVAVVELTGRQMLRS